MISKMAKTIEDGNDGGSNEEGTHPIGDSVNEIDYLDDISALNDEEREEYETLNQTLDELSNCLDDLEKRNDSLNAQFRELLELSRATRNELQMQQAVEQNEPAENQPMEQ